MLFVKAGEPLFKDLYCRKCGYGKAVAYTVQPIDTGLKYNKEFDTLTFTCGRCGFVWSVLPLDSR